MIYLSLFVEFFKIGLFSFGGGYATIPFLYQISQEYHWYSIEELKHMVAIASVTPGPVGINTATFAGLKTAGIFGSILATTAEILPALFLVIALSKILKNFSTNFYVKSLIETLKPISCALLIAVGIELLQVEIKNIKSIILLVILITMSLKAKKDPIFYITISAIVGAFLAYLSL